MSFTKIMLGLLTASLLAVPGLLAIAAEKDTGASKELPAAKPAAEQSPWQEVQNWKVDVNKGSRSLVFSPDGKVLTLLGQGNVQLWEVATGKSKSNLAPKGMQCAAAYSPDSSMLATGDDNPRGGNVILWDAGTGKALATLGTKLQGVSSLAFSPSGSLLATSGFALGTFPQGGTGMGAPAAQMPTLGSYVKLWDVAKRREVGLLPRLRGQVQAMKFLADAKTLAIVTADMQHSGVILWDLQGRKVKGSYKLPVVQTVSFSRDGESYALVETEMPKPVRAQPKTPQAPAGPRENKITLRATATGKVQQTFASDASSMHYLVALSPFGNQLAAVSSDGKASTTKVWNIKTGKLTGSLKSDRGWPSSIAWNPDSKKLALLATKVAAGMPGTPPVAPQPGTPGMSGMGGMYGQFVTVGYWGPYGWPGYWPGYGWPGYGWPGYGYPGYWGGYGFGQVVGVGFIGVPGQEGMPGMPAVPGKPGVAAVPPGAESSVSLWELKAEESQQPQVKE